MRPPGQPQSCRQMGEHPCQWDRGGFHSQAWSSCLWTEQCDNFFPPKDRLNYMLNEINDDTNSQQGQGTTTKIMQQFTSCPDPSGVIFMRSESSAGESPRTSAPLFAILPFSLNSRFIIFTSFVQVVLLSLKVRVINVITCLSKSYQIWKFILWVKEGNTVCENIYWQLRGIKRLSLSLPLFNVILVLIVARIFTVVVSIFSHLGLRSLFDLDWGLKGGRVHNLTLVTLYIENVYSNLRQTILPQLDSHTS